MLILPILRLRKNQDKSRGFTLIELAAVIFVLSLIATISLPVIRSVTGLNLKTGALRLSSSLRYVFNLAAMDRSNLYRISIKIGKGKWAIERMDNAKLSQGVVEYVEDKSSYGSGLSLPKGVEFRDLLLDGERISPEITETAYINFMPSGYVPLLFEIGRASCR